MGDALATWFEARSCSRHAAPRNECGGLSTMTGLTIARLCYDTLLQYGVAARIAAERQIVTPAVDQIVEANILLSGVGFESGGLASAHSIHNGLTALDETHAYYHGEKVAFGLLAGLQLTDAAARGSPRPSTPSARKSACPPPWPQSAWAGSIRGRLMLVAEKACAPGEFIHHEAGEMTPGKVLNAMLAADAIGEHRRGRVA